MNKVDRYRQALRALDEWDDYLLQESGLPGPRGNLELAHAVAMEGDRVRFLRYVALDAEQAPVNTPGEFLAFCGTLGMGRRIALGERDLLGLLRQQSSDPRWRLREAVAQALQLWGDVDLDGLLREMEEWGGGTLLEKRAAAAALCEPRLLADPARTERVLCLLQRVTASILKEGDRKSEDFRALRKGLGYCWSVAVAAHPQAGKAAMKRWLSSDDPDIRWIMKENLGKKRLERMDAAWVAWARDQLQ